MHFKLVFKLFNVFVDRDCSDTLLLKRRYEKNWFISSFALTVEFFTKIDNKLDVFATDAPKK
jgi:hypothetical protein